jgi:hypothetical protein
MKLKRAPIDALAVPQAQIEPWRREEWQRLWLSVQARKWRALAVVPAAPGGPPNFSLSIAVTLARTGMMHLGVPIQVADATTIQLSNVATFIDEVWRYRESGELILVALGPMKESAVCGSLAQSVDAALLCVLLDKMAWGDAKETVNKIGRERFVGSIVFHSSEVVDGASGQR